MAGRKPRLLDLFCGAGGCSAGYERAGFEVVGVDKNPQPHYPFEFHQLDAMALVQDRLNGCWHEGVGPCLPGMSTVCLGHFDAIHASPPCQAFTSMRSVAKARGSVKEHPELVDPIRQKLAEWGGPYVIENVPGAPMSNYVTLCGSMFGLGVRRHRLFETNWLVVAPPLCNHDGHEFVGVYGDHADRINRPHPDGHTRFPKARDLAEAQAAMGIDWMPWKPLAQAIPPAYTEYLGSQLINQVKEWPELADLFIKCMGPTKPPYGTPERAEWEAAWDANPRPCDTCDRVHKSGADFGEPVPFVTGGE